MREFYLLVIAPSPLRFVRADIFRQQFTRVTLAGAKEFRVILEFFGQPIARLLCDDAVNERVDV